MSPSRPATASRLQPRDDLVALDGYHSPQIDVPVRLNTNESPFPPPARFVDEWLERVRRTAPNRYPDRRARELRRALGVSLGQPAERILVGNGSNEVLQTLLLTYGGPGRSAAVFEPTYALHAHIARVCGTRVVARARRADFTVDSREADALFATDPPSVVFLCSPNNPSGTVDGRGLVEHVCDLAARHGSLLVVDEAYGEFTDGGHLDLVDDARPLVVVRTYSKVWSMAALRLGYAVGPAAVVADLEKVILPYSVSTPTQIAGTLALAYADEMSKRVETLVAERERVRRALDALDGVHVFPSGANFLLLRLAGDAHAAWQAMIDRGVLVRDFSGRPGLAGCLRVTVGTPQENDAFLAALGEALREVAT